MDEDRGRARRLATTVLAHFHGGHALVGQAAALAAPADSDRASARAGACARWVIVALAASALAGVAPAKAEVLASLGDSYSSGEGARNKANPKWDHPTGKKCHRSPNAWPRLLGVPRPLHFACSGAKIPDVLSRGRAGSPDDVPQLARLAAVDDQEAIDTVLLTIGGNDMDFGGKIKACYLGPRCLRNLDKLDRDLEALKGELIDTYSRVAESSWGELVVVGYPDLFPGPGRKFVKCGWIQSGEKRGIWHLQDGLNRVIEEAAQQADVDFIPIRDALAGRELCTRRSLINPVNPHINADPAHPNARGQRLIARKVGAGLETLYPDEPAAAAAASPWRECGTIGFTPFTEDGVFDIRARRVRCRLARRVARASEPTSVVDGPFRYRVGGFRCSGRPQDQALPSVRWTCRRRKARVSFVRS